MEYVAFGARGLICLIFVVSAFGKVRDRAAFTEFTRTTRILLGAALRRREVSRPAATWTGRVVVAAEIAAALLVLFPVTAAAGLGVAAVLLGAFSVAMVAALRGGVSTSCRCFGASTAPIGRRHVVRNVLLICAAVAGLVAASAAGSPPLAGMVITAVAVAVVALLMIRLDDLYELFAAPEAR
ncbi:MauE/DoxX family redox-associated membrane protein [Actinomadura rudentiformis]|uniref:Methylamine utilization protein MauE n=1 Tax=Actinomadura rudentiformis TaxID=359158 RepID=A0A6H9YPJ1_9ACTN|nr:MauE/DoxX family redox-associated membrane protein [Actinomadura rudentiformis]KAB2345500.1 methylamine utilization protein MauE [Actinomadura rudentiformis]